MEMTDVIPTSRISTSELTSVAESSDSIPAERLERARQCYSLRLSGKTYDQISDELDMSRSTVIRRLNEYRELYAKSLAETPQMHLLAEEITRLDAIEAESRISAFDASTPSTKNAFLKTALSAVRARQSILLETGLIPREPAKLLTVHGSLSAERSRPENDRTDEEIRQDIQRLLKHGRRL